MENRHLELQLRGLHCAACVARTEAAVRALRGVRDCTVNLATGRARVDLTDEPVDAAAIIAAVRQAGYEAVVVPPDAWGEDPLADPRRQARRLFRRLIFGAAFTLPLVGLVMLGPHLAPGWACPAAVQLALALPVLVVVGSDFYRSAWRALASGKANMDVLVALGVTAAFAYSLVETLQAGRHMYYEGAAMILTVVTLGRYLEARVRTHAAGLMVALATATPRTACVVRDGHENVVPADQVQVDQIVVVRPGEQIPVDGVVVEGASTVDQSALTGESQPLERAAGDEVLAATLNGHGLLRVRATRVGRQTLWQQTVEKVRAAQASKAPIQRLADQVAAVFVPLVGAVAVVTLIAWLLVDPGRLREGILAAVAVLVISCPCALGLATPVAVVLATAQAARRGILILEAAALEEAGRVDVVLLDKTGTLTAGRPAVSEVLALDGLEHEVLEVAAAAERGSEHPLARAIVREAENVGLPVPVPQRYEAVPGHGGRAVVEGAVIRVGSPAFLEQEGVDMDRFRELAARVSPGASTLVGVAKDQRLIGAVLLADKLREGATAAVAWLKRLGCEVQMVTGDSAYTAAAVAAQAGIDIVHAETLPAAKADLVARLQAQGRCVAMVGDGINDAPALVAANVGLAIGSGADVAREAGHIVIVPSDPRLVAEAIALSRRWRRVIRQNLFWAFLYNGAALPLAGLGLLDPMIAAAAMAASSLTVMGNSLRLARRGGRAALTPEGPDSIMPSGSGR